MHIQLNDQYRLYGHSYGYSIQRKETSPNKEGGIQWSSFLHYTNLSTAITGYADYRFRTADTENLESALATIEGVKNEIRAALLPEYTILDESGNMV